ncbi:MAG: nucleotidyltransferase family protein [Pseudomonadota bacterium]|nr:nucleotidyltransferase family protein [Pseudomonadota bacterium]
MTAHPAGDPIVGILLAAGSATRFGGGKLLAPLDDGTPLGVRALRNLAPCVDSVIAVVRPGDEILARQLADDGATVIVCPYAENGMGQSLAWAARAAPLARAWVVALGDMPWIQHSTTQRIVAALDGGAALVAATHRGARGHPVGFSRRFFADLAALSGDEGARTLLHAHAGELELIATDDEGVGRDVDTRPDLIR